MFCERRSDHDRGRPPQPQLRRGTDETHLDPNLVLPGHLRDPGLRRRHLRPSRPSAGPAPSNPLFMGTLGFCVEAAVAAVGGEENVEDGDIILINVPYATGTHQQDAGVVTPVFVDERLIGYVAIKAHWQDMGAKEPYSTDTVDVFQEGVIFPGVKLYERGVLVPGDLPDCGRELTDARDGRRRHQCRGRRSSHWCGRGGANRASHGHSTFWRCVERMFDHGEAVMRQRISSMPDGRYVAHGLLDNDGIGHEHVQFEIAVVVDGSEVTIDFSAAPPVTKGPIELPVPQTVSASRVAIAMLAGPHEPPNEGHFRPLTVRTVPGTLFHPESPAPTYLSGWLAMQVIDVIHRAFATRSRTACRPVAEVAFAVRSGGASELQTSPGRIRLVTRSDRERMPAVTVRTRSCTSVRRRAALHPPRCLRPAIRFAGIRRNSRRTLAGLAAFCRWSRRRHARDSARGRVRHLRGRADDAAALGPGRRHRGACEQRLPAAPGRAEEPCAKVTALSCGEGCDACDQNRWWWRLRFARRSES